MRDGGERQRMNYQQKSIRGVRPHGKSLPTAPLRTSADVDGAIDLFHAKGADLVVSYTPEAHPVRWHKYLDADNSFVDIFEQTIDNRQALRTSYYPNGAVYVFRTAAIKDGLYYTNKSFA